MTVFEDILVPFPETLRHLPTVTECRSTLLITSLRAVQERGRIEDYKRFIDPASLEAILAAVGGVWIPIEIGRAHYRACDALGFSTQEQLDNGAMVVTKLQETFIATVLKFARTSGAVDPWTGLAKFHSILARSFRGGGGRIVRLGPKEARLDVVGMPLASIPYFRVGFRGFVRAGALFFAKQAFCSEIPKLCTDTAVSYRLSWV